MLARRLEESRIEKKMTKKEVADALQIDQSTYGKYELGKREPDAATLLKLADLFEVSVDYILGRTDIKTPVETIAAHHDGEDWTDEELEDIENFKEFVRMRREQKKNQ
ncbi:MAG: helix-turn-helix transcriptional regulator [Dethiobacter sp.]|nr:helix-turn-helix transcriptional regulator [Dethiobacter sp.]MBS3898678.1 helix-turn-helix transcriptional regulator [Dethiobacter sp.]